MGWPNDGDPEEYKVGPDPYPRPLGPLIDQKGV